MTIPSFLFRLAGRGGLTGLTPDHLALVTDPLALVGLGLANGADVGGHLADGLLVDADDIDAGVGGHLEGDPLGGLHLDGVAVADGQLQGAVALGGGPVADAHDLEAAAVALGHPGHHVGDQGAEEAVQGAALALVVGPASADDHVGVALALCAALFAATAYLSVKVLTRTDPPLSIVWWFSALGALFGSAAAADMPDVVRIEEIHEPWIEATIFTPDEYLGGILKLCQDRRGRQKQLTYVGSRAMVIYELPLNEVVFDFYDRLKSVSRGYASFDYHIQGYEEGDLVKLSILVNAEPVDALSIVVHRARAESRGRSMCEKLKDLIKPHLFQIPIQAAIGGKVIARETIKAMRKDVIAKCYGGDISRKRKLLDKQKAGKKKMREFGKVEIPQEAFIAALKMDDN